MGIGELVTQVLDLDEGFMKGSLEGISEDDLGRSPDPKSNNIGWLVWHKMRTEDSIVSMLSGAGQVFSGGDWSAKLGQPNDPGFGGRGQPPEEAAAFKVKDVQGLKEYCDAVRARTKEFLATLNEADLDRELPYPGGGTRPAMFFLAILLVDGVQHSGQAAYLRGLYGGYGWSPA